MKNRGGRESRAFLAMETANRLGDTASIGAQRIDRNGKMLGQPLGAQRGVFLQAEVGAELLRVVLRLSLESSP
jgi:hypothetical protein